MVPNMPSRSISGDTQVAGTHVIAAPGASYEFGFSHFMKTAELLPPAVADCTAGKIDEHRRRESETKTATCPRKRGNSSPSTSPLEGAD